MRLSVPLYVHSYVSLYGNLYARLGAGRIVKWNIGSREQGELLDGIHGAGCSSSCSLGAGAVQLAVTREVQCGQGDPGSPYTTHCAPDNTGHHCTLRG